MTDQDSDTGDWYISGEHARRAIGYLGALLAERGDLPTDFEQPFLLDIWGEALTSTVQLDDKHPSPIGAAPS